jgi:hypothetical protein
LRQALIAQLGSDLDLAQHDLGSVVGIGWQSLSPGEVSDDAMPRVAIASRVL